jgi:hypothetical protein
MLRRKRQKSGGSKSVPGINVPRINTHTHIYILPGAPFGTQKLVPLYFGTFHIYVFVSDGQKKKELEFLCSKGGPGY